MARSNQAPPPGHMKALSIRQPWAWLILYAGKDIENREWSTNFRGTFLIHAAKGMTHAEYEEGKDFANGICGDKFIVDGEQESFPEFDDLPRGGIIGAVELVACVKKSESPWFMGTNGFVLRNPESLVFKPMRGQLGFFDVPWESEG